MPSSRPKFPDLCTLSPYLRLNWLKTMLFSVTRTCIHPIYLMPVGADPGFFLGGGALVSSNKPHSFFCRIPVVLENRRSSHTPCTLPLDLPLGSDGIMSQILLTDVKIIYLFTVLNYRNRGKSIKKVPSLKRDLDARALSESYR